MSSNEQENKAPEAPSPGIFSKLSRFAGYGGIELSKEQLEKEEKRKRSEMSLEKKLQVAEEHHRILVQEGVRNPAGAFPDFPEYCKKQIRNATRCNEAVDLIKFEEWHPKTRTGRAKDEFSEENERGPLARFFLGRTPNKDLDARKPDCTKIHDEYKDCKKEWASRQRIAMREYYRRQEEMKRLEKEKTDLLAQQAAEAASAAPK